MAKKNSNSGGGTANDQPPEDPAATAFPASEGDAPAAPAAAELAPSEPPSLDRDGKRLVFAPVGAGTAVEASRERHSWIVEAELAAGDTSYAPVDHRGTGFYRLRNAHGVSNDAVIHFNS